MRGLGLPAVAVAALVLLVAYRFGADLSADPFAFYLFAIGGAGLLAITRPVVGLYAFLGTVFLVPYDWRVAGVSAGQIVIGAALFTYVAWVALGRVRPALSWMYLLLLIPAGTAWMGYVQFGNEFNLYNVPYILSLGIVLCFLTHQLISTRKQFVGLIAMVVVVCTVRNILDLAITVPGMMAGQQTSAIRNDALLLAGTVTTQSEVRSLILPLLVVLTLATRGWMMRVAMLAALTLNVSWMMLSMARTSFLGALASTIVLALLFRGRTRAQIIAIGSAIIIFGGTLAVVWTGSFEYVRRTTIEDFENPDTGRPMLYKEALERFVASPIYGGNPGPSHSYLLGAGQAYGLVYLAPLVTALAFALMRSRRLRKSIQDPVIEKLLIGIETIVIVSLPLNLVGTGLLAGGYAYPYWTLVGAIFAVDRDVRAQAYAIVRSPQPAGSRDQVQRIVPLPWGPRAPAASRSITR